MNYKIIIQYDGTKYDGWQKQGNTPNTIQGKIEGILSRYLEEPIEIAGAGRTDAGVHAKGQVANFHTKAEMDTKEALSYLNHYLPHDIGVLSVEKVQERFHSRLNAKEKVYAYHIGTSKAHQVFCRKYQYLLEGNLDIKAMETAATYLVGEHDFKSFCANKKMKKSTVRTIYEITITKKLEGVIITYRGNGFLYNMVRILTGTLLEVGQGKRQPEELREILEAKDRQKAGVTAPAQGLFLEQVIY